MDRSLDALLSEPGVLPARDEEPLLAPETETQTVAMLDLPALVFHEQEEVAQVVGVLDGVPKIRFQHGAEGGLAPGLPEPLRIADRPGPLTLQDDG